MGMRACYVAKLTRVPSASEARALDHKRTHAMHLHLHGSANLNLMGYRRARACVRHRAPVHLDRLDSTAARQVDRT